MQKPKIENMSEILELINLENIAISDDILKSDIMNKIILEIYNGWTGEVGLERVINAIKFIAQRIPQYANMMDKTELETLELIAKARNVNYVNWFQNANLPDISNMMIFETVESFKTKFPSGKYVCPSCGGISTDYQECNSGKVVGKKGEICNWKVYGLFLDLDKGIKVLVKNKFDIFPKPIRIFKPIELIQENPLPS